MYANSVPQSLNERWKKLGVVPGNIEREIVEILHRTIWGLTGISKISYSDRHGC